MSTLLTRVTSLLRSPDGWGHLLIALFALVALGNGAVIVSAAKGMGDKAAAGWFIGIIGLVLIVLAGLGFREDLRGGRVSVMSELATTIIAEEEAAGREVGDHFQAELPLHSPRKITHLLLLTTALLIGWMVALPWIGFGAATGIFCLLFMRWMSRTSWLTTLITAVAVGAGLAILFTLVGVILPTGALWYLI